LRTDFLGDFFVKVPNQGPNFFDCLTGTFDAGEVTSVKMGLPRGKPWIAKLPRPAGTTPLTLDTSVIWGTGPLVVWVDQRTHIIRQWASEGPGEERPPSAGPGQPTARSRSSYTRWYATAQRIAINGAVPAETFAFKPPAGVKVVEAKDSHWMMRAILGMEGEEPSGGEPSASAEAEKNFEGKAPIDFTAIDLDGKPVALSSFKGKPVVLDFWATWCPPCRAELPLLEEAYAKLKAQGLEVVAVAVDETVDDVKKFLQDNKLSFTVLWLDGSTPEGKRVSSEYGVTAIPRTLYIGPDWVIKSDTTGLHEKSEIYKALSSIGLKTD
jgi:thiol-disulfide isomerase/thioredoxin